MTLKIRWMIRVELPTVLDIEQQSFPYPWTEQEFLSCLRDHNVVGIVAERQPVICQRCDGKKVKPECWECDGTGWIEPPAVVGYAIYELHKTRLHLVNLAVDPNCRRMGVAKLLMDKLKSKLGKKRHAITLYCGERNLEGQKFLRSQGLLCEKIVRDCYQVEGVTEDGYYFRYCQNQEAVA